MCGNFVETSQKPQWNSVEEYRQYLISESPNPRLEKELFDPDIKCKCCTQEAPHVAAAMIKVEDTTPYGVELQGDPGHIIWICADCYTSGVRPKNIHYGNIKWNKQGRRIKNRAEKHPGHPW